MGLLLVNFISVKHAGKEYSVMDTFIVFISFSGRDRAHGYESLDGKKCDTKKKTHRDLCKLANML